MLDLRYNLLQKIRVWLYGALMNAQNLIASLFQFLCEGTFQSRGLVSQRIVCGSCVLFLEDWTDRDHLKRASLWIDSCFLELPAKSISFRIQTCIEVLSNATKG